MRELLCSSIVRGREGSVSLRAMAIDKFFVGGGDLDGDSGHFSSSPYSPRRSNHRDDGDDLEDVALADVETYLDVNVRNPITHQAKGDYHTSYDIAVETNNRSFTMARSLVRRRYSEFFQLRKLLTVQQPSLAPPSLPSRTFVMKRFDHTFVEDRRRRLETFVKELLSEQLYLSNKSVHLFVQTNLSMDEIRDVVKESEAACSPESKPPIVLALHDNVDGSSGAGSDSDDSDGSLKPLKSILRKTLSAANLHSFKCPMVESHNHIRIGSRISICQPTLHVPIPEDEGNGSYPASAPRSALCPVAKNGLKTSASDPCLENMVDRRKRVSFCSSVRIA